MNIEKIHILPDLKDRIHVFRNREDAGERLAEMLQDYRHRNAMVLGIAAGGVPVSATLATRLDLPLLVIPVSKILFPWTTESGFGAVAFDGTEWINEDLVKDYHLDTETIQTAIKAAQEKIQRRLHRFFGTKPLPELKDKTVIIVDDGIAAGSTMRAAITAVEKAQVIKTILAVPTAHGSSLYSLVDQVEAIYCANLRGGYSFAVADAYEHWTDVTEEEVMEIIQQIPSG
jgi:predicted phosphoribosyltransferase